MEERFSGKQINLLIVSFIAIICIMCSCQKHNIVEIDVSNQNGIISRSIYENGKKVKIFESGNFQNIQSSVFDQKIRKEFFNLCECLNRFNININYPEVIYEDICVVAGILSNNVDSINCNTKVDGNKRIISLPNIETLYTFLNASIAYVNSFKIVIDDNMITYYQICFVPNFSDSIDEREAFFYYNDNKQITSVIYKSMLEGNDSISICYFPL